MAENGFFSLLLLSTDNMPEQLGGVMPQGLERILWGSPRPGNGLVEQRGCEGFYSLTGDRCHNLRVAATKFCSVQSTRLQTQIDSRARAPTGFCSNNFSSAAATP